MSSHPKYCIYQAKSYSHFLKGRNCQTVNRSTISFQRYRICTYQRSGDNCKRIIWWPHLSAIRVITLLEWVVTGKESSKVLHLSGKVVITLLEEWELSNSNWSTISVRRNTIRNYQRSGGNFKRIIWSITTVWHSRIYTSRMSGNWWGVIQSTTFIMQSRNHTSWMMETAKQSIEALYWRNGSY